MRQKIIVTYNDKTNANANDNNHNEQSTNGNIGK